MSADDPNDAALEERRRRLRETIAQHEAAEAAQAATEAKASPSSAAGYAKAMRMSSEFISAIAVGGVLGFGLDYLLGTKPWLMIVLLLLGFVAGVLNVLRSAGLIQEPRAGKKPPGGL